MLLILNYSYLPDSDQGLGGTRRDKRTDYPLHELSNLLFRAGFLQ